MTQLYDCRDAFENKLRELASQDQRIVAVVNDSVGSSKLNQFGQMYPVRLVNVGIAEQNMIGVGAGLPCGELGPTHHSIEDMAWLRAIANMKVIVPADPVETAQAVEVAASTEGPMVRRLSRLPVPVVHDSDYSFEIGKAALLRDGGDVTLIANGVLVCQALAAAEMLGRGGVWARVGNSST